MKVLIIKTSSLGDVIHTLPAVTDAASKMSIRFDWVVEEAFTDVPAWHPAVDRVIPIGFRRWRRSLAKAWRSGEVGRFISSLRQEQYDLVIDAQGLLLKSGIVSMLAKGMRVGYDRRSVREPLSALAYQKRYSVSRELNAVERIRRLFAQALQYEFSKESIDYGIESYFSSRVEKEGSHYLLFLHSTTWRTKHWPEQYWAELASLARSAGYEVLWVWYTPEERLRAERLMAVGGGKLAPRSRLNEMAELISGAAGVVGVDSGLAHLAAALARPGVTLYGPTSTKLTGAVGARQKNLASKYHCAPCFSRQCREVELPVKDLGPSPADGFQPGSCCSQDRSSKSAACDLDLRDLYPPCFIDTSPSIVWQALTKQILERD